MQTYSQSYFHLVFSPKNRQALIQKTWKNELEKYITGIIQNNKHKLLTIESMPGHINIFIGYNLNHRISDLVEEYLEILKRNDIKYNDDYLFDFFDNY